MNDSPSPDIEEQVAAFRDEMSDFAGVQPAVLIDNVLTLGRAIRDADADELAQTAIHEFLAANADNPGYAIPIVAEAVSIFATTSLLAAPLDRLSSDLSRLEAVAHHLRTYEVEWPLLVHTERAL